MEQSIYAQNRLSLQFLKTRLSQTLKMGQSTPIFPSIYNFNTLKWVTFLEIIKTDKKELLDINYNENKKYSKGDLKFFSDSWTIIQDDVFVVEENDEAVLLLKKCFERFVLESKVKLIQDDANLLIWLTERRDIYKYSDKLNDYEKELQGIYAMIKKHDSRIKINCFASLEENYKVMEGAVLSMVNEYNTKFKDVERKVNKAKNSLFHNVAQVNRITGLQLNAMTMVCPEWLESKKIALEINKSNTEKNERLSKQNNRG